MPDPKPMRFRLIPLLILLFAGSAGAEPRRIVTLAPSLTEILFFVGAADQVAGVSDFCNYPPSVKGKPTIGGINNLNYEALAALQPDLVLCPEVNRDLLSRLKRMSKAPVKVISTDRVSSITANIRALGQLTGHAPRANALALGLEKKIALYARTSEKIKNPPLVFYYLWNDPLMTAGGGSYIDDLIRLAGGKNVAGGKKILYPIYSWERLILDDPEVIFGPSNLEKELRELGKKSELRAAKKRRIYSLDADVLSRPGPRVIEALEKLSLVLKKG
ncbi:MAG TPA: hypothetical protein DD435_03500 [Cyanobacteria bacterium UBA8530]|nr:hypothetical protein [Cyanobacteria bacterium UBA8530]